MVLLKVENLSKSIDNKKILDNLNFEINEGEIVGFIGENGAGKSTTFKTLLNLISKDEGLVLFFNEDLDLNINLKNKIGTVFDAINLPSDLTAKQLNNVFQEIFSEWNQNEYFDLLKEFDLPLNKKVSTLSRGMSMKLSVSISMAHNAKVLLLDEATGGLDPVSRNKLLEKLQVYNEINNGAILLSSHILGDVQKIATHLIILKKGKIILKDSKENIMQNYAVVEVEDSNIVEKNIIIYQTTLHNNKKKILISDRSNIPKNIEYKAIDLEEMVLLLTGGSKMKGLLLTNYYLVHRSVLSYIFIASLVAFVFLWFSSEKSLPIAIMIILLLTSLPSLEIIKKENSSGYDRYVLTLPVSKKNIVTSHYIFYFVNSSIGVIVSFFIFFVYDNFFVKEENLKFLDSASLGIFIVLFGGSLVFPLLYLLGPEKSDAIVIGGGMIGLLFVFIIQELIKQFQKIFPLILKDTHFIIPMIYIFLGIIIYLVSYYVSRIIYLKKEF